VAFGSYIEAMQGVVRSDRETMAAGNIYIRCPGCGNAQSVAMAVGQQLQCPVCQTVFFAPVVAADQLPPATAAELSSVARPGAGPISPGGEPIAADGPPGAALSETRAVDRASASPSWRTDGLAVEPPAAAAPRFEPQRDTGQQPAAPAAPHVPGEVPPRGGGIWTVITVVASLIIVTASLPVGIHFARNRQQASDAASNAPQPSPPPAASAADAAQSRWTDAAQRAQRLGQLEVKVVRAKYGAVRAKDLNNEVITTDDSNLLAVTVSVLNRGNRPRAYSSWYAGGQQDTAGVALVPELWDDQGRGYALLRFDDVSSIEGQQLADEIQPHHDVQDTVVFLVPADVDRTKIKFFRLSLPAHAIGTADFCRFEIPVSMIRDF
jgi:ribosomal protein S27E